MNDSAESIRHANFLREMGLPVLWRKREQAALMASEVEMTETAAPATAQPIHTPQPAARTEPPQPATQIHTPQPAAQISTPELGAQAQQTMVAAQASTTPAAVVPQPQTAAWDDVPGLPEAAFAQSQPLAPIMPPDQHPIASSSRAQTIANMDWLQLEQAVSQCTACGLCRSRTQAVLGVGDKKAQWLLVGEGPGRTEDAVGEPFVGKSGKLLDNMLGSLGLQRGRQVYIANIVKCRPTDANGNDRPPSEDEAAACRPFLERQIALLQPRLVLTLGKTAAISLLGLDPQTAVSSLRGKVQSLTRADAPELPLIATYHPAYLLRKPADKARAWADLCLAQATLSKQVSNDAS